MKIREILEQHGIPVNNQVINMGIMNGWNKNYFEAHRKFRDFYIPGTINNKELGRCYSKTSIHITDGLETFLYVYNVDSSD